MSLNVPDSSSFEKDSQFSALSSFQWHFLMEFVTHNTFAFFSRNLVKLKVKLLSFGAESFVFRVVIQKFKEI